MLYSLFDTVRRTRKLAHEWLPGESQLHRALDDLYDRMLDHTITPGDADDREALTQEGVEQLRHMASYIRVVHDIVSSPVSAEAVHSIADLIEQDLLVLDKQ